MEREIGRGEKKGYREGRKKNNRRKRDQRTKGRTVYTHKHTWEQKKDEGKTQESSGEREGRRGMVEKREGDPGGWRCRQASQALFLVVPKPTNDGPEAITLD